MFLNVPNRGGDCDVCCHLCVGPLPRYDLSTSFGGFPSTTRSSAKSVYSPFVHLRFSIYRRRDVLFLLRLPFRIPRTACTYTHYSAARVDLVRLLADCRHRSSFAEDWLRTSVQATAAVASVRFIWRFTVEGIFLFSTR